MFVPPGRGDEPAAAAPATAGAWRRFTPLMIVVAVMALVWVMGWHRHVTLEAVAANRDWLHDLIEQHRSVALLAYVAVYVAIAGLSLPGGTVLTLTGGLLFGWLGGALAAVVGATAGATIVFLIARTTMGDLLAGRAGPFLGKLRDGFKQNALHSCAWSRHFRFGW